MAASTATLLDSCMGLAVQSTLDKGISQTTLEFKISLVRPITPETGPIRAEGKVLNCGRRIGTADGRADRCQGPVARSRHDDMPHLPGLRSEENRSRRRASRFRENL